MIIDLHISWEILRPFCTGLGLLVLAGAIELAQEALVAAELTKYRVGAWSDWLVGAASVSMGLACYDLCRSIGHFLIRLWGKVRTGKVLSPPPAPR